MNAVEIEQAITELAQQTFDAQEFPFEFLRSFGNKETTIKRLRSGNTNRSDVGGVLQRNNIHIAVAEPGKAKNKKPTCKPFLKSASGTGNPSIM